MSQSTPLKSLFNFFGKVFSEFSRDRAPQLAASIAYYSIFSLAPIVLLLTTFLSFFLKSEDIRGKILTFFQNNIGQESAETINSMMQALSTEEGTGIAILFSVLVLLFASTNLLTQMQYAFNVIWDVQIKPQAGLGTTLKKRLLSFALLLLIGLLIFLSLLLSAGISLSINFLAEILPILNYMLPATEFLLSLAIMSFLFIIMFRYFPDVKLKWSHVWRGGLLTGILFFIGKVILAWYFTSGNILSSYGAAGSFIAILLWVYYSTLILLLGAEFTQVWLREKGIKVKPDAAANRMGRHVTINVLPQSGFFQKIAATFSVLKVEFRIARFLNRINKALGRIKQFFRRK
jgi:membrane protein